MVLTAETYDHINNLERIFESLANVPSDNPELLLVQKLSSPVDTRYTDCVEMLEDGFGSNLIVASLHIDGREVRKIKKEHHIPDVPGFNYIVGNVYFPNKNIVATYYKTHYYSLNSRLRKLKIPVQQVKLVWKDIPLNATYCNSNARIHIKKSYDIRTYENS